MSCLQILILKARGGPAPIGAIGLLCWVHIWFTSPLIVLESYPRAWIDHYSEQVYAPRHPTVA